MQISGRNYGLAVFLMGQKGDCWAGASDYIGVKQVYAWFYLVLEDAGRHKIGPIKYCAVPDWATLLLYLIAVLNCYAEMLRKCCLSK